MTPEEANETATTEIKATFQNQLLKIASDCSIKRVPNKNIVLIQGRTGLVYENLMKRFYSPEQGITSLCLNSRVKIIMQYNLRRKMEKRNNNGI